MGAQATQIPFTSFLCILWSAMNCCNDPDVHSEGESWTGSLSSEGEKNDVEHTFKRSRFSQEVTLRNPSKSTGQVVFCGVLSQWKLEKIGKGGGLESGGPLAGTY